MGLSPKSVKVKNWEVNSSSNNNKSRKVKKKIKDGAEEEDEIGCWVRFRFMESCMPSRSKVDSTMSGTSTNYDNKSPNEKRRDQPVVPVSSTTTSNAESTSSTPKFSEELKIASQLRKFGFNDLKLATRNFRPESLLGEGGFGCVFKGWVEDNGTAPVKPGTGLTVAVKTLNHDGLQGHKEWLAEVNFLGNLLHPNLVKLVGYCIEDDQRLLVYEFMPRGSLENHLFRSVANYSLLNIQFPQRVRSGVAQQPYSYVTLTQVLDPEGSLPLPWAIRMKIALGAAKGLAFLHEEAEKPVIYRDFKTSNILLDADYNAKLSDFGLAKDAPEEGKTHVSTRVNGNLWLCCSRICDDWPHLGDKRRFYRLLDPRLEGHFSIKGSQKAAQLAGQCLSRDPKSRPRMTEVVEALKPLPNLKDMASSSYYFQSMQADHNRSNRNSKNGGRTQVGFITRNGQQPMRSLSNPNGHASPYHLHHPSPKPNGKK
ncbi:hypothetical protein Patl1_22125 [Pistacia atlantica]|uniref:Uncharacterized protein n=1 Tax=Pistacia atlantica TaxID=434234 RepID=A0ACC1BHJ7_9ROSI|nr:hypothetical protein Patl1_22125 [Pistacia atlantica]